VQAIAVGTTLLFAGVASVVILGAMKAVMVLRVPMEAELSSIDISEHGEEAYHGSDLSDLTGRRLSLGDPVVLTASDMIGVHPRHA
jgi:Amt family ammonium transporter